MTPAYTSAKLSPPADLSNLQYLFSLNVQSSDLLELYS